MFTSRRCLTIAFLECLLLIGSLSCHSVAQMPAAQSTSGQSRDIKNLHFPQRWYKAAEPGEELDYTQQIEVRKLPNAPADEFLFAALQDGDNDYEHEWNDAMPKPKYSGNSFVVNLTPTPRARAATKQQWESATRIVTKPRLAVWDNRDDASGEVEYRGKKFQRAGKYSDTGWLSPGGRWLAVFSYTGERKRDLFMDGGSIPSGDIFWQVYDMVTGEKVFEWQARGVDSPTDRSGPVSWLDERHFLFPQDLHAQKFAVVTLPEFIPEKNPVTIQLPSRTDPGGARVSAPANHPVWAQLPLTREQEARFAAQQGPELVEVRVHRQSSSRELFLAIREVTENTKKSRAARGFEPGANYNYRLFSTYYYAISRDDPTQSRFASKEEWESASGRSFNRRQMSEDKTIARDASNRPQYRTFPKLGATSGGFLRSSGAEWTAVLSYTELAGANASGKMFVEIFETRPGNKFSSTEFPYTGSAEALLNGAFWIEDDYLLVPLKISLDSFVLWKLP